MAADAFTATITGTAIQATTAATVVVWPGSTAILNIAVRLQPSIFSLLCCAICWRCCWRNRGLSVSVVLEYTIFNFCPWDGGMLRSARRKRNGTFTEMIKKAGGLERRRSVVCTQHNLEKTLELTETLLKI